MTGLKYISETQSMVQLSAASLSKQSKELLEEMKVQPSDIPKYFRLRTVIVGCLFTHKKIFLLLLL